MMPEETAGLVYTIRPCRAEDLDALRDICEETSSIALTDENARGFLLLTFCDGYVRFATGDSFVAVDGDGRPVGYIFCAADTRAFFRDFRRHILPEIRRLGPRYGVMARAVCFQQRVNSLIAPAHMHIDLTASARRQGVGTALIGTLKAHLAAKGVRRLVLSVSKKNVSAIRFYQKNGFRILIRAFGVRVMRAQT